MNKFTISCPIQFSGDDDIWQVLIIRDRFIYCPNGEGATESTREKAILEATKQMEKLNNENNRTISKRDEGKDD